jgi:hypothetical protein
MNVADHQTAHSIRGINIAGGYLILQQQLLRICIFNFFLLSLIGLLLRAWPIFDIPYLIYKNVLHAHSHFAFGGWVTPILVFLILRFFPEFYTITNCRHWRNSIVLMLLSSYGMLLSFPFGGYGAASIIFSTLSIGAGFYLGVVIRSAARNRFFLTSTAFLLAGFFYFFISSIGPFSTGPLIAMGKAGTTSYYNAIYLFLHFQYNGFFTFIVLGILYKLIERNKPGNNGKLVFRLMNIACIPAYFLSVLWAQPPAIFYFIGGAAALVQLIAVIILLPDIKGMDWVNPKLAWLFRIAIIAFITKTVLQLLSAFPGIAQLAYQNRNFIIAYLHLVLLGFISLFVFVLLLKSKSLPDSPLLYKGILGFVFAFVSTELLLVLQAGGYLGFLPNQIYLLLLFVLSICFPAGLFLVNIANNRNRSFTSKQLTTNPS